MKKKGFMLVLALILVMTSSVVFAEEDIIVRIDSTNVEFNEESGLPFIDENDLTLIPFRAVLEAFGAEIEWDSDAGIAKAIKEDITIEVPIGEEYIVKNGEEVDNDAAAAIRNDRTYLPIRKVMEAYGADVQWDQDLRTVVITSEPVDAKANVLEAYEKSYAWENYDMYILMDMSMAMPDEAGNIQEMDMQMDMTATAFMDPMKMKVDANMVMEVEGTELSLPIMKMYMLVEEDKYITYTGMTDMNTGELTWIKQEVEDESFAELLDPNNEEMKKLNEESIKEAIYLGTYSDEDRNLEKYEITVTFEGFDEIIKQSMAMVSGSITDEDLQMSLDLLASLDDMTYILYIDEASGEFVKIEMDLSPMIKSMLDSMMGQIPAMMEIETEMPEDLTEEEIEELNQMFSEIFETMKIEIYMVGEYLNINNAEDFEIPEEALNAISMEEYMEQLEEALKELEQMEIPEKEELEELGEAEETEELEKVEEVEEAEEAEEEAEEVQEEATE